MSQISTPYRPLSANHRLAAAVAALTATVGILGALALTFDSASSQPWLTQTPEVMASVAECEQLQRREDKERCKKSVVAERLTPEEKLIQMARR